MSEPAERQDSGVNQPEAHVTRSREMRLVAMREHSLLSLVELSRELSLSMGEQSLANMALLNLMGHIGCRRAALWLLPDSAGEIPRLAGCHGISAEAACELGPKMATQFSPGDQDFGHPLLVGESQDELAPRFRARLLELGIEVIAPMVSPRGVSGVVMLGPKPNSASYSAFDLDVLATSLGMVGFALETTRLYQKVTASNEELAIANRELRDSDRLKSEFIQNVNHELRTPIAIILGAMDCLLQDKKHEPSDRNFMNMVVTQANKLMTLFQTLLDFSQTPDIAEPLPVSTFDLSNWLAPIEESYRRRLAEGGRVLEVKLADCSHMVIGDSERLRSVLDELLTNIEKFTPPNSLVTLRTLPLLNGGLNRLALDVIDSGPGIAPELIPDVFSPFRQGDGSSTRTAGGLGMGLAAAKNLMKRMNGNLVLASESGTGAIFRIVLRMS